MRARSWTMVLFTLVVGLLVSLGVYRLAASGDVGDFVRNLGIAVFLTVFSVVLLRNWDSQAM
ncbi:hypothetical protein GJR96_05755 [Haloferax sp. MBLA0076]|uniref:DUF8073 domain-containing protein n=1 Tax=Haloferax litoreum TaxID=2666140 RepID=A0A6A8GF43_9EURY|nr:MULTISPECIES: hypothetical protein [Haloferax]KAB1192973.1 hypothetical protein Hfx1148_05750 [Haloferax sp. CBA1148]MRX21461.1 hypothetical protein [Haloferax litoreum]